MKKLCFIALLFLVSTSQAQVRFSVGAGVGRVLESTSSASYEFAGVSYTILIDSMAEKHFFEERNTSKFSFTPKLQYSIFGGADFRLTRRMELSTGLGFSFFNFAIDRSYSSKLLSSKIIDTVPSTEIQLQILNLGCDSTVVLSSGGAPVNNNFGLLDLHIPISLKYELFDGFKVDLGARISTPIYTRQHGFKYERTKKLENGMVICTSSTQGYNDHSGYGFRQIRLSVIGGIHYRIQENLEVNLLAAKSMHNVFVNEGKYNEARVFKPVQIRLGASLFLGGLHTEKSNKN